MTPFPHIRQLYDLVLEMGCTPHRALPLKTLRLAGAEVKDLDHTDMLVRYGMSSELARNLQTVRKPPAG